MSRLPYIAGTAALVVLVIACGGDVVAPLADASARDAAAERAPLNACEPLSGKACSLAGCLPVTAPSCPSDVPPVGDGEYQVERLGCVPRIDCTNDTGCPTGQRCLNVRYSRCAGIGCTADAESRCTGRLLCVYPGFP